MGAYRKQPNGSFDIDGGELVRSSAARDHYAQMAKINTVAAPTTGMIEAAVKGRWFPASVLRPYGPTPEGEK